MTVEFGLLGSIEARIDGRPAKLGHARQRGVLAALLVDVNQPVNMDRLTERVWGERPPRQARATLHGYVSRLRQALACTSEAGISRGSTGYVLTAADTATVDLHLFRALLVRARAAEGDLRAVALYEQALRLWRAEAFATIDTPWVNALRDTLGQERFAAELDLDEIKLRIGQHAALLPQLVARATAHPLDERLAGQVMTALHRCGRPADALDHYQRMRRRLRGELGIEPAPALREIQAAILRQDVPARHPGAAPPVAPSVGPLVGPQGGPRGGAPSTGPRSGVASAGPPAAVTPDGRSGAAAPAGPLDAVPPAGPLDAVPPAGLPGAVRPHTPPAQLPLSVAAFTGRDTEIARLDRLLSGGSRVPAPTSVVISAVEGTAGVGKTALAVHWAHRVRGAFPDGQLYVNLRGFDPEAAAVSPEEAVRGFVSALGVPPGHVPAGLEAQTGLFRSLMAGRRVLILLDNARDADQVRPLLPGAPGCLTLVTSRNRLTSLAVAEGAQLLAVDLLTPGQARDLLTSRLGARRVAAEPAAVEEIVARCAGLPLALAVVAARAAAQPSFPLALLAEELRRDGSRLDALDGGDPASQVRAVFSWSYRTLSPDAARMFRLLGLHPGPDVAAPAAAAVAHVTEPHARTLLAELTRAHLLTEHVPGRYAFHDLLRAYAVELARARDRDRREATHRMLDHYLHTARTADALLTPQPHPIALPPARPGAAPQEHADHQESLAWFTAEHRVLVAAVKQARGAGFGPHAWRLASTLTTFLDRQGGWQTLAAVQTAALEAARGQGDEAGQADAHRGLGLAHDRLDRPDEARAHYLLALDLFSGLGNRTGQARTHQHMARMSESQGLRRQALEHAHHSLEHYRAVGDPAGQSAALNHIGWILAQFGAHQQALDHCRRALALAQRVGDLNGQAHIWDSLGYIRRKLGQYDQAVGHYRQALTLFHQTGDRHSEASGLACLGETHRATTHADAAHEAWTRALEITRELGLPDADPLRTRILHLLGRPGGPDQGRPLFSPHNSQVPSPK
ncbi:AfsR/SARP family transcriptional regulator [Streptomyces sp. NPDC050504]|uniref:AfsR/SARP family transcriptional regulator n=1 Tax=Streptomyces sp. NPDC050504 TaxID=3365618 RepID=UPI0037B79E71